MNSAINSEQYVMTFFDAISDYVHHKKYMDRIPEIIQQGLLVFKNYPFAVSSSLFMIKDNSFEFEHRSSLPPEDKDEFKLLFGKLIESGIIGTVLESGTTQIYCQADSAHHHTVLIPLIVSWGVIGLVIVRLENECSNPPKLLNDLTAIVAGLFAAALENSMLFKNLGTTKAVLEQKVASRTMDLAQSQRELKAILDSVQTGILIHDSDTNIIVKANPVAIDLIGTEENKIVGEHISLFMQQLDYSSPLYAANFSNRNFESYLLNSKNDSVPIIRTTSYLHLGNVKYRIESFLDITERKQFEEELRRSNEMLEMKVEERTLDLQLLVKKLKDEIDEHNKVQIELKKMLDKEKELNEMKTRFVSMVSHEFRTPLTVIRSAAQMMNKFKANLTADEQEEYITRIIKTVDTLTDLIENVLFIGKQNAQTDSHNAATIDLVSFTQNLINEFKLTLLKSREIPFQVIGYNSNLVTNEKLLRLILINLLSNAAKYSSSDSQIVIKLYLNDSNFTYIVQDNGIGIPEIEQEKIFKLFYRADNVGNIVGTGIGLPVVLNSVQMLNGKINLESRINHGTTFTITIPHYKTEN